MHTPIDLFLDAALKTVAYLRVSPRSQDLANQKLAILEFSQKRRFPIDQFIESRISSRKSPLERRIDEMLGTLQPGDPHEEAPDGDRGPADQSAGAKAMRSMPSTTSKWASLLNTGRMCWRASAAIQTSLDGRGLPRSFSSKRIAA